MTSRHIARSQLLRLFHIAILLLGVGGCDVVLRLTRSTDSFLVSQEDARVFYEPGAETAAHTIALSLNGSIKRIEDAQYGSFVVPINVYVCATLNSYGMFTGDEKSGGNTTIDGKIFISPKPQNTSERLPAILTHELSHLHLGQRLSIYRRTQLPTWFSEGLAVSVSDGGGAENVTEAQAKQAILAGQHIAPNASHTIFTHDSASHVGLSAHMFYRQAAMFIADLKKRDAVAYQRWITSIESGTTFNTAFETFFHTTLDTAWREFVRGLNDKTP